jgi:hypothetical protein
MQVSQTTTNFKYNFKHSDMKNIYIFLLLMQTFISAAAQSYVDKITSISELGFSTDNPVSQLLNVVELDERYLHLVIKESGIGDGDEFSGINVVYDLQKEKFINYTYDSISNKYYGISAAQGEDQFPIEIKQHIAYHKGKIYHADRVSSSLMVFDLQAETRKIYPLENIGAPFISTFEHAGKLYLTLSGSSFLLLEINEDEVATVFRTETLRDNYLRPIFFRTVPKYHNNKLIISEINQIRAYDFETQKLGTLMEMPYLLDSLDDYGNYYTTMLSQVLVHNSDVYFVYKQAAFSEGTIELRFSQYFGTARVFKSDGTLSGSKKVFDYYLGEIWTPDFDEKRVMNAGKLMSEENQLFWLGFNDDTTQLQLYKVEETGIVPFEQLPILIPDNVPFVNNLLITYQYDNTTNTAPVHGLRGDDLYYVGNQFVPELYLWTIENDSVKFLLEKSSLFDLIDEAALINFYPVNKDSVLLMDIRVEIDSVGESSFWIRFSLLDVLNQTISKLDSVSLIPYPSLSGLSHLNAQDGDLFFSGYNTKTADHELWIFSFNKVTAVRQPIAFDQALFTLYPNPTAQNITLQSNDILSGQMMIMSIDGKIHKTVTINGNQQQVDVSALPNGLYLAILYNEGQAGVQRFVIQR